MHVMAIHPRPTEVGQEGRVNVQDSVPVGLNDTGGNQLQVTSKYHQLHPVLREQREPLGGHAMVEECDRRNSPLPGPVQRGRVGPIAQDQYYLRLGRTRERIHQGDEVRAPTGDADGYPHWHGART
jgi:hypothetical protein